MKKKKGYLLEAKVYEITYDGACGKLTNCFEFLEYYNSWLTLGEDLNNIMSKMEKRDERPISLKIQQRRR